MFPYQGTAPTPFLLSPPSLESHLFKGKATAKAQVCTFEVLKSLAKTSPARAVLDLTPPAEITSTTLQAVSGFILEFIKFQCHPYS